MMVPHIQYFQHSVVTADSITHLTLVACLGLLTTHQGQGMEEVEFPCTMILTNSLNSHRMPCLEDLAWP